MGFLDTTKRVHVIGAGGIGVSAVARLLRHEGKEVSGSDVARNETVDELIVSGIPVTVGHDAANLPDGADLVVYSGAVPPSNPERAAATERGVRQLSYFEFLGEFSKERWTIAVSGTNGKSTTTAMLGLMLERGGLDPTVIVGSKVRTFPGKNLRLGESKYFVVEACEHEANMLKLRPKMIVLTNIEEDHLDFYRDLAHISATFREYVHNLPPDGKLVLNADDHVSFSELAPAVPFTTYAMEHPAAYMVRDLSVGNGRQLFRIARTRDGKEEPLGGFELGVPGRFNVMNALAAATAALELGCPVDAVAETLREFTGIWRRFERVGERNGAVLVSDYGHHPTAIRGTLEAARSFFPDRRIVLVFQPHQHNRTRKLFDEFVASFDGADVVVLPEIFDVAGRESDEDAQVSSYDLAEATRRRDAGRGVTRQVHYGGVLIEALRFLETAIAPNDLVLLVGAGDVYTLAGKLRTSV
ncbi:MAG TPA: UDP-N-acetylmuramate--L-alanine ligase [Candidatus Binatia bacterium]|jgi:UDP-N-acetylmuramate--alanine ligase|nr:UDP-N-acetylmuramate--L-alanine ligase [Candidatus Binatia bacterium]